MECYPPQNRGPQDSVSVRIVKRIAAHEGVDPIDLSPPLYTAIDPDALNSLFEPPISGSGRAGRVTFTYRGHTVIVENAEDIAITIKEHSPSHDERDTALSQER
ncbi:hypothetical protein HALLA_17650 [Halostagnicola larsenii XH-48]|uniref:Halobacterial output domain-containing protein n=1 Tax=Halostagnicola larsenii XH-48 TaxID=797299 RepID=W0JT13_9EURY|nr:HalOD1 output domain-containing protein [Halostagnicola larsenii]AHG00350.1 hypothetical protein HALLA_17650 [Halostagnicola larsenii XH-48]